MLLTAHLHPAPTREGGPERLGAACDQWIRLTFLWGLPQSHVPLILSDWSGIGPGRPHHMAASKMVTSWATTTSSSRRSKHSNTHADDDDEGALEVL